MHYQISMNKIIIISILLATHVATAANLVTDFAHWLPSIQLNLYNHSEQLVADGIDTPNKIEVANQKAITEMYKKPVKNKHSQRRNFIEKHEAIDLLYRLKSDPVTTYDNQEMYDPKGHFGFCFGRATWVWLEAIKLGLAKDSIKKIFLVGPMHAGNIQWQFHVATAVRGKVKGLFFDRETWYVIDPNFERPMTLEAFYEHYRQFSIDKKLRLFVTEPQRLGPSSTFKFGPQAYSNSNNEKEYNAYFADMLSNYRNKIQFRNSNKCKHLFPVQALKN